MNDVLFFGIKANDNERPWKQGFVDGVTQAWSEHAANHYRQGAADYLAGWLAGADLAHLSS